MRQQVDELANPLSFWPNRLVWTESIQAAKQEDDYQTRVYVLQFTLLHSTKINTYRHTHIWRPIATTIFWLMRREAVQVCRMELLLFSLWI